MKKRSLYLGVLFFVITMIFLSLVLYGQAPTPLKGSNEPKPKAKAHKEETKTNQAPPKVVSPIEALGVSPKNDITTANDTNKKDDKPTREWWLIAFTGVLAGVGILQCIAMYRQSHWLKKQSIEIQQSISVAQDTADAVKKQTETMRHELILTHRPKLRIRNVVIRNLNRESKGEFPRGQLFIDNVGNMPAQITNIGCWVKWMTGGLPMERPYEGENPNYKMLGPIRLEAGQSYTLPLPTDGNEAMEEPLELMLSGELAYRLYVMGYVEYSDDLGIPRSTTFCRVLANPSSNFFATSDPDYEYED